MPDPTPAPDSDLSAAIAEYQKRWETPATDAPKADNPDAAKAAVSATEQAPAGDATSEEKPDTAAPEAEATEDLSHIPEQYRESFKALPPEAKKWAKEAMLRQSDYTKKTQATAEQRKAVEAEAERQKDLLTFAANVLGDKEAVARLKALAAERDKGPEAVAPATPFSWADAVLEGNNDLIDKEISRRAETIAAKKAAEVEARLQSEVKSKTGPNPLALALIEAHGEDHDNVALDAAFKAMQGTFEGAVEVTPENVAALIKPFLPKAGEKVASKAGPTNGASKGASNGVSPLTRGSGALAPLPPPPTAGENGKPKTRRQLIEETLYDLGRSTGNPITLQDIGARMRGDFSR